MLIRRMTATFGRLREQTLELQDGLNILQAPNETGKSTWCAFLLAMLYGVNTKERDRAGVLADKNRYAPWDGGSMSGRLDCRAGDDALTLFRTTRRQTAPMGDFQALYTGTADPVPGLTGANCGETLLGVSREVYARSAFIRQGGVAVTQDSGLERRIAALVTSGEEDTSYTEAVEALKKQLNRRRHNKTGQLPALEAELQETEAQLASQAELARQRENLLARSAELEARESSLKEELAGLDRWAEHRKRQDLQKVEDAAVQAEEKAAALRRRLEEEQVPENDVTVRLRGAIVNLNTVRKSAEKAQEAYDAAKSALAQAEEKLSASPFAGQTAEEARRTAAGPLPKARRSPLPLLLTALACLCVSLGAGYGVYFYFKNPAAALGAAAGLLALTFLLTLVLWKRAGKQARSAALTERYGTADSAEIQALADAYAALLSDRDAAKQEASAKSAAAQGLWQSVDVNADGILEEVRSFAPAAYDIPSADAALRASALLRRELSEAEKAAHEARLRVEFQAGQTPAPENPPAPPPAGAGPGCRPGRAGGRPGGPVRPPLQPGPHCRAAPRRRGTPGPPSRRRASDGRDRRPGIGVRRHRAGHVRPGPCQHPASGPLLPRPGEARRGDLRPPHGRGLRRRNFGPDPPGLGGARGHRRPPGRGLSLRRSGGPAVPGGAPGGLRSGPAPGEPRAHRPGRRPFQL